MARLHFSTLTAAIMVGVLAVVFAASTWAISSARGASQLLSASRAGIKRPLHLPQLRPGEPCPTSAGRKARLYSRDFGSAAALGPGPVFPVIDVSNVEMPQRFVRYRPASGRPGVYTFKVLFIIRPTYKGPVLVRGRRLDSPQPIWFGFKNGTPLPKLTIPSDPKATDWRGWPSQSYIKSAGCYGYQIDGTTFSRIVIVQTKPA